MTDEARPAIDAIARIHLDAVGGVAGDMFVAAMLDALPALKERVLDDVAAVVPAEAGAARLETGTSGGMAVLRFRLDGKGEDRRQGGGHDHHEDIAHPHHHGPSTLFPDLCERIRAAALAPGTAEHAVAMLTRLAETESRMHGVPRDEVHFHELADWDSLMDVVAAGSIAAALSRVCWSVSELPRGGGLVRTQHGLLPVPAPATAAILEGFGWRDDGVSGERVTPTGAVILAHLVADTTLRVEGRLVASGMGAGTRELPGLPNILRVLAFAGETPSNDDVCVVAFDIDDMTGEEIGIAAERLRVIDGVIDLTTGQRAGKKHRPVTDFRLLIRPEQLEPVCEACFEETSTLGLRWRRESRLCLPRDSETRRVAGRQVRIKRAVRPHGTATVKAESGDLAEHESLDARRKLQRAAEKDEDAT